MIKLQVRRDTAVNWTNSNPELLPGELCFELDTGKIKIGKVTGNLWNDVPYVIASTMDHTHNVTDINSFSPNVESVILDFLADSSDVIKSYDSGTDKLSFTLADTLSSNKSVTGAWTFNNLSYVRSDLGNVTGATSLNLANGGFFTATVTGNITISVFVSSTGAIINNFGLKLINGGAFIVTWPASFKWNTGTAPTLTTSGKDIFTFITDDNGATWYNVGQIIDAK